jgi:hypothetical protein
MAHPSPWHLGGSFPGTTLEREDAGRPDYTQGLLNHDLMQA